MNYNKGDHRHYNPSPVGRTERTCEKRAKVVDEILNGERKDVENLTPVPAQSSAEALKTGDDLFQPKSDDQPT